MHEASRLLNAARRSGRLLDALPAHCQPTTIAAAHAIQDASVAALGEAVAGWKIAFDAHGATMRGALLGSRVLASPARLSASLVPMLCVEAEIAFRVERALPPRGHDYSYDEVAQAVTAMAAIEIVDTRFRDFRGTPVLHRLADCMSSGGFVLGTLQPNWRGLDLKNVLVNLSIDGKTIVEHRGGHPAKDPLLPAVALVNAMRTGEGVAAGRIMTTGTFTGMNHAKAGQEVVATFEGVGSARLTFDV